MPYTGGRTWVDVAVGATAPPGSPDFEQTTMNAIEADIAAAFEYKAGETARVKKDPITGFWPSGYNADRTAIYTGGAVDAGVRPTANTDVYVIWQGPDPSPATVSPPSVAGMYDFDERHVSS
jgi:hypothetical protein